MGEHLYAGEEVHTRLVVMAIWEKGKGWAVLYAVK